MRAWKLVGIVLITVCAASARATAGDDGLVGQRVVVTGPIEIANVVTNPSDLFGPGIYEVVEEQPQRVLVRSVEGPVTGWVSRDGFVKLDKAVEYFDGLVAKDPKNAKLLSRRARTQVFLKNLDAAIADFTAAIELETDDSHLCSERADAFARKGDMDRALEEYRLLTLRIDPHVRAIAHCNRGATFDELERWDEALAEYDKAIEIDPSDDMTFTYRANMNFRKGDVDGALRDFDVAIALNDRNLEVYSRRAEVWKEKGNHDKAIEDLTKAISLDPASADFYSRRAYLWHAKGDLDKVIADCIEASRLNPQDSVALALRGAAYSKKEDYERALTDFDSALKLNPNEVNALFGRGDILSNRNEHDRALADFETLVRLDPNDADALAWRGVTHWEMGDLTQAFDDLNQAIGIRPEYAWALRLRGQLRTVRGEYTEALGDYNKAIALDPTNADAYCGRGDTLNRMGDRDAALIDLNKAIEILPENAHTRATRGKILMDDRKYGAAAEDYAIAARLDPKNFEVLCYLGQCHEWLGQYKEALENYEKALVRAPDEFFSNMTCAWLLSTSPDPELRDGKRAVTLATKACEVSKNTKWSSLQALAAAHAEVGDFSAATSWQAKALDAITKEDEWDREFGEYLLSLFQQGLPYRSNHE